jgi:hypothetical protein
MGATRIKKASKQQLTEKTRRQGAIPCVVLLVLGIIALSLIFFFALRSGI